MILRGHIKNVRVARREVKDVLEIAVPILLGKCIGVGGQSEVFEGKNLLSGRELTLAFDYSEANLALKFGEEAEKILTRRIMGFGVVTYWGRGKIKMAFDGEGEMDHEVYCSDYAEGIDLYELLTVIFHHQKSRVEFAP